MATGTDSSTSARPDWRLPDPLSRTGEVDRLHDLTRFPPPLCELLVRRGFAADGRTTRFLRPRLEHLHPPRDLPGIDAAVERISEAIASRQRILVHGDYDVDGMTGAALLALALRELGADAIPFVPHRARDGYDLGEAGVDAAVERGARLIVTVDCGISAHAGVERAARAGLDVIVTDHHRPGPELPPAVAVINPNRTDSAYPYRSLAGVGVAFKLVQALFGRAGLEGGRLNRYLDLVALGTVADQAPLTGENRVLVRYGLRVLARTRRQGLRSLLREARVGRWAEVDASDIGFRVAPRLNSAGRVGDAVEGLELLLADDPLEADRLARRLERHNELRRETDRAVVRDARALLSERFDPERDPVLVLWGEGWHPGVLGIAASRLVDELHRPVVLVGLEGERGRGSARSVPGFHLYRALDACSDLFERFGGHEMAAGFDVRRERLGALRDRLRAVAAERFEPPPGGPGLDIDLALDLGMLDDAFLRGFGHLEPFGTGHASPRFLVRGARLRMARAVGIDGRHLRARLDDGTGELDAIAFGHGARVEDAPGARYEVAFELLIRRRARGALPEARVVALRARE